MAERSYIYQATQIGVETTPGTPVAANKKLLSVGFSMSPNPEINTIMPSGYKYPTGAYLAREWTELDFEGALTYTEIVYLLSGILNNPTPTGSGPYTWAYTPQTSAADTIATYTIEQGDAVRARRVALGLMTELGLSISRSEIQVSGSMLAGPMEDNVTLTGSPTDIELVPVLGHQIAVYVADTAAGLDGASALDRPINLEWTLSNRFAPAWYLNQQVGFDAYVEVQPELTMSMMMASDAEGMQFLTPMRQGDKKFIRIEATGNVIDPGPDTFLFQLDTSVVVTDVGDFSEEEGIEAIEWEFTGIHDSTMGGAVVASVVNEVSAL